MRLRATHLVLRAPRGDDSDAGDGADALAVIETDGNDPAGTRVVFVPGRLPCGECAVCRRGLCEVCPASRAGLSLQRRSGVDLPERYLTPTEPALAAVEPAVQACAGFVAEALDATARSGLGPGETAIWIGAAPETVVGASLTARRGCRTFLLGAASDVAAAGSVTWLDPAAGPARWSAVIGEAEAAATVGSTGRPERRLYVYGRDRELAESSLALVVPGATISLRRGAPALLAGLDAAPSLRLLIGGGYHPDLVPEALAALARDQIDLSRIVWSIDEKEIPAAMESLRKGDSRIPVVRTG